MEKEKKVIKISLGKFIAIVIAIIIILFIGINFLAYKMEKPNLISSIEALIKNDEIPEVNLGKHISSKIGVEFNYPEEWEYVGNNHENGEVIVGLTEPSNEEHKESVYFSVSYIINEDKLLSPKIYAENNEKYKNAQDAKTEGTIKIDGNEGYYFEIKETEYDANKNFENKETIIYVQVNSLLYKISFYGDEGIYNMYYESYKKMLETVNFIEQTNTEEEIASNRYSKEFEEMLVEYILNSIETYTKNGVIIKSTDGDITAESLTIEEFNKNREKYKNNIKEMINNKEIFEDSFISNGKETCKYNLEKILNKLGIGTHMGTGTGQTDEKGYKTYSMGDTKIDTTTPTSESKHSEETASNRYSKEFEEMLVEYILNSIETYTKNGVIIKSTDGDITAESLTIEEFNKNREKYKNDIKEMINNKEIFEDSFISNGKETCKYNLEKILNKLGIGTHMGTGTGQTDEKGYKTYSMGDTKIDTTTPTSKR